MPKRIAIDSGPLVALFDRDDQHHDEALQFIQNFSGKAVTNLAVLTEVTYLLDFSLQAQTDFLHWVEEGALTLIELGSTDFERIIQLMEKYADRPMDFADASLVTICERLDIREIASIDRDFKIYRFRNRGIFKNVFYKNS